MSRNIPLNKLPDGYEKEKVIGKYSFYKHKYNKRIIWKRDDKNLYILNIQMKKIPDNERSMFWFDSSYCQ